MTGNGKAFSKWLRETGKPTAPPPDTESVAVLPAVPIAGPEGYFYLWRDTRRVDPEAAMLTSRTAALAAIAQHDWPVVLGAAKISTGIGTRSDGGEYSWVLFRWDMPE